MCVSRMLKSIIVAQDESFRSCADKLLHSYNKGVNEYTFINNIKDSIEKIEDDAYDLCIIEIHKVDYQDVDLLVSAGSKCSVIIICDKDDYLELFRRTYKNGYLVLPRPVTCNAFLHTLEIGLNARDKMKQDPNNIKRITDLKYITSAKLLLVLNEKMGEQEAHRYVEKLSMDLRVAKQKACEYVIGRYIKC